MPVTTRRAKALNSALDTHHGQEIPDNLDSLSQFSDTPSHATPDEDSDWEPTGLRKKDLRGSPRKKRARLDKDEYTGAENRGVSRGKLDVFPSLPLDIIYEVLSLLPPVDLANLTQTNRAFRATLITDPQSSRIWSMARKRHGNGPECPPDVPMVPWVRFVYAPPKCGICGAINVHFVDFQIRRRLCKNCRKQKLVYSRFFAKRFPEFEPSILELIPHTWIGSAKIGRGREASKFYWEGDIYVIAEVYVQFQSDVYVRKPGAKEALKNYRSERIKYVQAVEEHANKCVVQWSDLLQFRARQAREHAESSYSEIFGRCRQLGYEDEDISAIRHTHEATRDRTAITEKVWARVKNPLTRVIEATRCRRLERHAAATIDARKRLVKNAYNAYKRSLRPVDWIHLPPPQLIYVIPAFRELIYTKLDEQLDQATCDEAAERLPGYISTFMNALKRRMLQEMADSATPRTWRGKKAKRVPKNECGDKLFLATSVFSATGPGNLYSFDDVAAYLSEREMYDTRDTGSFIPLLETQAWGQWDRLCAFNSVGSQIAEALVIALGLDPATARPQDLDEMDRRFVCEYCTGLDVRAYNWRRMIPHHCTAHRWNEPHFEAMSEEESTAVRQAESADPAAQQKMWSCNHCAAHLDNLQTRPIVVTHVQETHAIAEPQEIADLFHAFPTARLIRTPLPYPSGLLSGNV